MDKIVSSTTQKTKITEATRRNIFDFVVIEKINWSGRLEESDFLGRLYDLGHMPSTDGRFNNAAGDIWRHRVNNPFDREGDWIFHDRRFSLLDCTDEHFLNFLCEMVHPAVRPDTDESLYIVSGVNDALKSDGYEL